MDDSDIAFAVDLFSGLGRVTQRKMFGGMCLYHDGTVFALLSSRGQIYLKTKTPEALFGDKTEQFHNMPYWALPDDTLDDADSVCNLARTALLAL